MEYKNFVTAGLILLALAACQQANVQHTGASIELDLGLYRAVSSSYQGLFLTFTEQGEAFFSANPQNAEALIVQTGSWKKESDNQITIIFSTKGTELFDELMTFTISGKDSIVLKDDENSYSKEELTFVKVDDSSLALVGGNWM